MLGSEVEMLPRRKQTLYRDVLIELWPIDANAAADQPIVPTGIGRGLPQSREPRQRDGHFSAIRQADTQSVRRAGHFDRSRLGPNR
jgi:hypothetical protein